MRRKQRAYRGVTGLRVASGVGSARYGHGPAPAGSRGPVAGPAAAGGRAGRLPPRPCPRPRTASGRACGGEGSARRRMNGPPTGARKKGASHAQWHRDRPNLPFRVGPCCRGPSEKPRLGGRPPVLAESFGIPPQDSYSSDSASSSPLASSVSAASCRASPPPCSSIAPEPSALPLAC